MCEDRLRCAERATWCERGFAIQVHYVVATGRQLAAELHLEGMPGVIVDDDAHYELVSPEVDGKEQQRQVFMRAPSRARGRGIERRLFRGRIGSACRGRHRVRGEPPRHA